MPRRKSKDEAHQFMFDLLLYEKHLHTSDNDQVWDRIIQDVMEYDRLSSLYMGNPELPCPIRQSERPDIVFECPDFAMGIECFKFDASKKTRKGSTQQQQEVLIDRKHRVAYQQMENKPDGLIVIKDNVNVIFSIENYVTALLSSYRHHVKRIPEYRRNMKSKYLQKKQYLSFYIEDATAIGNYVITQYGLEALNPLCIREFINELARTKELDYVIVKHQEEMYVFGVCGKLRV